MTYKKDEIKQLLREERSRGKKPPQPEEVIRRKLAQMRFIDFVTEEKNLSNFLKALNAIGLHKGTPDYDHALEAWHEYWQGHR